MTVTEGPTLQQRITGRLKSLALGLVAFGLVAALIEGGVSLALFLVDLALEAKPPVPERAHTRHDPELGWVSVPGRRVADLYGPGRSVTVNAQGLRNLQDFPPAVPEGRIRIVCSGDSFTFGFGVGDAESWPAVLATFDPRLEVANMAQAGYGLDQIYLWYRRDAAALEHQAHILAIVVDDVWRMRFPTFLGYGKPTLTLEGGRLADDGVPVPGRSFFWPWWTQNLELVLRLRTVELATRLLPGEPRPALDDATTWRLARAAVEDLAARHRAAERDFLFVFLPTAHDHFPSQLDAQRQAFLGELARSDIEVLDLVPALRAVPRQRLGELFIKPGEVAYTGAVGHYNAAGGRFMAERIWEKLRTLGSFARHAEDDVAPGGRHQPVGAEPVDAAEHRPLALAAP